MILSRQNIYDFYNEKFAIIFCALTMIFSRNIIIKRRNVETPKCQNILLNFIFIFIN